MEPVCFQQESEIWTPDSGVYIMNQRKLDTVIEAFSNNLYFILEIVFETFQRQVILYIYIVHVHM